MMNQAIQPGPKAKKIITPVVAATETYFEREQLYCE